MLVWWSLLLLVAITAINVCAVHANFLCRCLQTCETFKNIRQELQNTRVNRSRVSSLNRAVLYVVDNLQRLVLDGRVSPCFPILCLYVYKLYSVYVQ